MTQVTVKELAQVVDTPVERLLQQMCEAGLPHTSAEQVVTDNEKQALLAHLKSSHGANKAEQPRKITLQRKTTSTLRVAGSKSISVEVRKKKVFVERSAEEIAAEKKREMDEKLAAETAKRQADNDARREASVAAQAASQAGTAAEAPVVAAVASAPVAPSAPVSVVAAAPVEERKKDELRRPDKPRNEDAERRDRKNTAHRPSVQAKEKSACATRCTAYHRRRKRQLPSWWSWQGQAEEA